MYSGLDVDRNYWSDYTTLHPEATEVGRTGVWDTPYVCVRLNGNEGEPIMFDNHPLVNPIKGAGAPEVDDNTKPAPTASTEEQKPELFSTALIIIATVAVFMIIVGTSLLVYFKKHK
ncbi:MAG: hypothetical protein FWD52_07390 [Candidatus Bathyarchaeota archaeon]|nr:hypothetical protein [Candidatus Termiticorpusculum sp.]